MVEEDKAFVRKCVAAGVVHSPCLEMGGNYETSESILIPAGVAHFTTDIIRAERVHFVADFEDSRMVDEVFGGRQFGSVICLNILEHTFEPIKILDNIFRVLRPRGTCIITTPVVWPLHDYPLDVYRLNPHFYEEYARRRGHRIVDDLFEYLNDFAITSLRAADGSYSLPPPTRDRFKALRSRIAHKLFDTTGRGLLFRNHLAIGVVIENCA